MAKKPAKTQKGARAHKAITLTDKQRAFVHAYCANGFNGVRAAKAAGYSGSYTVLRVVASENLSKPYIRAEIDKHFKALTMGADEVLIRLSEIARGDFADLTDKDGNFDFKTARRRGKSFLIKEQEITEKFIPQDGGDDILIRTTKIKLHDPLSALNLLSKYHGLLSERLKIDDWRSEAIEAIRKGELDYQPVAEELGESLAEELFRSAGVKVNG
ncbi:MAG: terminase small subunit [Bryobacterales bacterium]|nr:terminase small subunit [Bryobacterales bacterium]